MLSCLPPIGRFDLEFICIFGQAKNLIIILLLTTLQCYLGSLEFGLDVLITRMMLICKVESIDACLIIFFVRRLLSLRKKPVERMRVQLQCLRAVNRCLLTFHLYRSLAEEYTENGPETNL